MQCKPGGQESLNQARPGPARRRDRGRQINQAGIIKVFWRLLMPYQTGGQENGILPKMVAGIMKLFKLLICGIESKYVPTFTATTACYCSAGGRQKP